MVDKLLSVLALCLLLVTPASATDDVQQRLIANPEQDYAASPHPEFGGASGDKLVRLDLDLAGDGKATLFLTTKKFGARSGYTWTAYDSVDGKLYRRIDYTSDGNLIQFRPELLSAGKVPGLASDSAVAPPSPNPSSRRPTPSAETLNEWLVDQVRADEQLVSDALSQVGGKSLALLKEARTYVPFFLDVPQDTKFTSEDQKRSFEDWAKDSRPGFFPGGFIYRLRFHAAPPLYATSAGDWSGTVWRSLALGRDITLDPVDAWDGANGDYLYATLLAGVRPRLLVYDRQGEIKHQEVLDVSAVDFEQRRDAALKPYLRNHEPVLEMISLVEYLKDRDASWRPVDISGQFNLRNQQQRPDEQKRLTSTEPLTRAAAIHLLQALQQSTPASAPPATPGPNAISQTEKPAATPQLATSVGQVPAATVERRKLPWPRVVGIATLVVIVLLVWKRRM